MNVRRYAALTALLAGGLAAALPFAKSGDPATAPQKEADEGRNDSITGRAPLPEIEAERPDGHRGSTRIIRSAALSEGPLGAMPVLASEDSLPMLSQVPFLRRQPQDRAAATIHEPDFLAEAPSPQEWPVPVAESIREATPPRQRPPREHRIVDGESLSSIARRYFGDERMAGEILACNRDRLSDPALLPIGQTILIPQP
jgi:nucleoid-associated protein YgaU